MRHLTVDHGGGGNEGLRAYIASRENGRARADETSALDGYACCPRRKARHQGMILIADIEMGQDDGACRQRNVILENDRRGQIDKNLVADKALVANTQGGEPSPVDIDERKAVQDRVRAHRGAAQPQEHRSERRKWRHSKDRQQKPAPDKPERATRTNLTKR